MPGAVAACAHEAPLDPDFIQRQPKQLEALQEEMQAWVAFRHDEELQVRYDREHQSVAMGSDAHIALEDNNRAISVLVAATICGPWSPRSPSLSCAS